MSQPIPTGDGPVFVPRRPARPRRRHWAYLIGSLAWLVALLVLALVLHHTDAVELAFGVLVGAGLVGALTSMWMGRARLREEGDV